MEITTFLFIVLSFVAMSTERQISSRGSWPGHRMPFGNQRSFRRHGQSFNNGPSPRRSGLRSQISVNGAKPGQNINIIKQTILVHPDALKGGQPQSRSPQAMGTGTNHISGPGQQSPFPGQNINRGVSHRSSVSIRTGSNGSPTLSDLLAPGSRISDLLNQFQWRPSSTFRRREKVRNIRLPLINLSHNISFVERPTSGSGLQQNGGRVSSGHKMVILPNGKHTQPIVINALAPTTMKQLGATGNIVIMNGGKTTLNGVTKTSPTTLAPGEDPPESNLPENNNGEA